MLITKYCWLPFSALKARDGRAVFQFGIRVDTSTAAATASGNEGYVQQKDSVSRYQRRKFSRHGTCHQRGLHLSGRCAWMLHQIQRRHPATCGEAIDVPLIVLVAVLLSIHNDRMFSPGAKMSTHEPMFENTNAHRYFG